ncbi:MAG: HEPN domain-containing protein [Candidatus Omnitrophota bacterium]
MVSKFDLSQEWFRQAEYDLAVALDMFNAKRYIYCVFMCHLCIEKALKAHYAKKFKTNPPKTHDLDYLCEKIGIKLSEDKIIFIDELNDLSVPTRYPDELKKVLKQYNKQRTHKILNLSRELFQCLKKSK